MRLELAPSCTTQVCETLQSACQRACQAAKKAKALHFAGELFSDHLVSVQRVLEGWNVGKDLELAGLYHSIYGAFLGGHPAGDVKSIVEPTLGCENDAVPNNRLWLLLQA